jgi:hypothetical protein
MLGHCIDPSIIAADAGSSDVAVAGGSCNSSGPTVDDHM